MTSPAVRPVMLYDGRDSLRPPVPATVRRSITVEEVVRVESLWQPARSVLADAGAEHAHWDWRLKLGADACDRHDLIGVECEEQPQGLMAVLRLPVRSRLAAGPPTPVL